MPKKKYCREKCVDCMFTEKCVFCEKTLTCKERRGSHANCFKCNVKGKGGCADIQ